MRDVLIRGNTFIGCGVCIDPAIESASPDEPIHECLAGRLLVAVVTGHREPAGDEDLAALAIFLASPVARYITGTVIPVDGGWSAQ